MKMLAHCILIRNYYKFLFFYFFIYKSNYYNSIVNKSNMTFHPFIFAMNYIILS